MDSSNKEKALMLDCNSVSMRLQFFVDELRQATHIGEAEGYLYAIMRIAEHHQKLFHNRYCGVINDDIRLLYSMPNKN